VSIFEDPAAAPSPRYKTKDPLAAALAAARAGGGGSGGGGGGGGGSGGDSRGGAAGAPPPALARLRTRLLREAPAHVGVGPDYGRAVARFGAGALADAWARVAAAAAAQRGGAPPPPPAGQQRRGGAAAAAGAAVTGAPPPEQVLVVGDADGWGAAEAAALAGMLEEGALSLRELDFTGGRWGPAARAC
jgi:hypothetical protein